MSTPLERGVDMLKKQVDARVESYFSSCVHCGVCAEACLFYTETNDPRYTPIYKTEPLRKVWQQEHTLWGKLSSSLGINKKITESDLSDWEELVYDGCSMCSRCSMVCPVGIDIAYLIRKVKEGLAAAGFVPEGPAVCRQACTRIWQPDGINCSGFTRSNLIPGKGEWNTDTCRCGRG